MGNSLHNKIPLGRASRLNARSVLAALVVGLLASAGIAWVMLNNVQ